MYIVPIHHKMSDSSFSMDIKFHNVYFKENTEQPAPQTCLAPIPLPPLSGPLMDLVSDGLAQRIKWPGLIQDN